MERTIYIPYEKLKGIFEREGRGVFLPYREFLDLWNQLKLPDEKPKDPPREGVVASASYTGRVEEEIAIIEGTLRLESFKEGWASLVLGKAPMSIAEASSDATLHHGPEGYEVIFPRKGIYQLALELRARVRTVEGTSRLELALPNAAASRMELVIPGTHLEFDPGPGTAYSSRETPEGTTRLALFFGASERLAISWHRRAAPTELKPLLIVESAIRTEADAGALRTDATLEFRILRAPVDAFEVAVPADQKVLTVTGPDLKDWTLAAEPGRQRISIRLEKPARERFPLRIGLEQPMGTVPGTKSVPLVQALGVERQSGTIDLAAAPELLIEVAANAHRLQRVAATDTSAAPGDGAQSVGRFRFLETPYALPFDVRPQLAQVDVKSRTLLTVLPDRLLLHANVECEVKRAGIFSVSIRLPAEFEDAEASGPAVAASVVTRTQDAQLLEVRFGKESKGTLAFELRASRYRKVPDEELATPTLHPLAVARHEGMLGVAVHTSLDPRTAEPGDLRPEDAATLGSLPDTRRADAPLTLGFSYRGDAKPARLTFKRREPRVSVDVLALLEIRETLIRHTWQLVYDVEFAGTDTFSFAVPAAVADQIRVEGERIKEKTRVAPPPGAASAKPPLPQMVPWKISLRDRQLGRYQLAVSLDLPLAGLTPGAPVQVSLPELRPLDVFRETGQVAIVKDGNLEITRADATHLDPVDPKELDGALARPGIFLAYKYSAHPIALMLGIARNLFLEVPSAIVTHASIGSVVAEDRAGTVEVVYHVRNNTRQFFSVRLPDKGRMLSDIFVDGTPQQPAQRPGTDELLIRLPADRARSTEFPVRFLYEIPSARPGSRLGAMFGSLALTPPTLLDTRVIQTRWRLYLPAGYRYTRVIGAMRESERSSGWDRLKDALALFIPRLGQGHPAHGRAVPLVEPPPVPKPAAGFDFQLPTQGVPIVLTRLDAPAPVEVRFQDATFARAFEALCFLLALGLGLYLTRGSRRAKYLYTVLLGGGALIVAGASAPRAAGVWHSIYLGVFLALIAWVLRGTAGGLAQIFHRLARWLRKTPPPSPSPPPTTPTPPPPNPSTPPRPSVPQRPAAGASGVDPRSRRRKPPPATDAPGTKT